MADTKTSRLPRLSAEQRRAAAGQFERASQVLASGDYDYGLQLLCNCCHIDPGNPTYRTTLRQHQKAKYKNNQHGASLSSVSTLPAKWRLRKNMLRGDHLQALVDAEQVLMRNPWDVATHLLMAQAFDELELLDLAVWTLEQVRPLNPREPQVLRPLARLYEKRGNFTQAIALWEIVRKQAPDDQEAQHKAKDLAASATIAKGRYEEAIHGTAPTPLVAATTDTGSHQALTAETETAQPPAEEKVPKEVAALRARIQATPTNVNAYMHLAHYYRRAEQPDKARDVLREGLAATNNNFEIGQELLDLDIDPFRRDLAIAEEKLRKQPQIAELQRIRTGLTKEVNTRELDYFRRRSDRFPTDVNARYEMALRLLRIGQLDEAIKELQSIRNDPRYHARVLFYLGFCFKHRNNWRLAQRNFEEALPQLADEPDLHKEALYQLAVGCADSGDLGRAVDLACELVNLDFGYKNISELLDTWQAKVS